MTQTNVKHTETDEKKPKAVTIPVESLKKEIEEYKKTSEEYKTKYLRALADYQNFERRSAAMREELVRTANAQLIINLLGFLDNLEKAELFMKDENLKMITDSFYKVLHGEGLRELPVLHKEFDPYTAEVIDMTEGEKDNIVVKVLRKGYEFNGKIIRVAQVVVSKKKLL